MMRRVLAASLESAIQDVPRVRLANLPTPLMHAPRLGTELGVDLWIKREDMTELALGGNKARILEFSLGKAIAEGADLLIACGYAHSNHSRQIAAAAIRAGVRAHLICCFDAHEGIERTGNFLLADLMGVDVEFVAISGLAEIPDVAARVSERFTREGSHPVVLTGAYPGVPGTIAYINAGLELLQQCQARGVPSPDFVVACSTACTQAGMIAVGTALGLDWKVVGFAPAPFLEVEQRVAGLANAALAQLGLKADIGAHEVHNDPTMIGSRYGVVTQTSRDAVRRLARAEAIFLEPIYTGKAFAGLIRDIEQGRIPAGSKVVFLHTGGIPILFEKTAEMIGGLE